MAPKTKQPAKKPAAKRPAQPTKKASQPSTVKQESKKAEKHAFGTCRPMGECECK